MNIDVEELIDPDANPSFYFKEAHRDNIHRKPKVHSPSAIIATYNNKLITFNCPGDLEPCGVTVETFVKTQERCEVCRKARSKRLKRESELRAKRRKK